VGSTATLDERRGLRIAALVAPAGAPVALISDDPRTADPLQSELFVDAAVAVIVEPVAQLRP